MSCRIRSSRNTYQANLSRLNAPWIAEHSPELKGGRGTADGGNKGEGAGDPAVHLRADGDADVEPGAYLGDFVVPACEKCGGILKVRDVRDWDSRSTTRRFQRPDFDRRRLEETTDLERTFIRF